MSVAQGTCNTVLAQPSCSTTCPSELGHLLRRVVLPEKVCCLAPMTNCCVAAGTPEGVEIVSWNGSSPAKICGFQTECLAALGSQSLAAGDASGIVRVWHYRRGTLKQVHDVHMHEKVVRSLANGGDVLFTASDDGTVRQLDVLVGFKPTSFIFSAGLPVCCVCTAGRRAVLAGCEDGQVMEVHRKNAELLRCMKLGASLTALVADDVDNVDGRVLAAGGGRVHVWCLPAAKKGKRSCNGTSSVCHLGLDDSMLLGSWASADVMGAVLLPHGGPEDFLLVCNDRIQRGPWETDGTAEFPIKSRRNYSSVSPAQILLIVAPHFDDMTIPSAFVALSSPATAAISKKMHQVELFEIELPTAGGLASEKHDSDEPGIVADVTVCPNNSPFEMHGLQSVTHDIAKSSARGAEIIQSSLCKTPPEAQGGAMHNTEASGAIMQQCNGAQGEPTSRVQDKRKREARESHYWDATAASRSRADSSRRGLALISNEEL